MAKAAISPCLGICGGLIALPSVPGGTTLAAVSAVFAMGADRHISGRAEPPEPYPPRTTDMG
jgi:hypothetical protein